MTLLLALLLAAAGPDADEAPAYADLGLPRTLAAEEQGDPERPRVEERGSRYNLGLELGFHYSVPSGTANHELLYVDNPNGGIVLVFNGTLRWSEVFTGGWGTTLTGEINMIHAGKGSGTTGKSRSKMTVGGYLTLGNDHFWGRRAGDGLGNSIDVDDMTVSTYLVGLTTYGDMGDGGFVDGRIGLGAVHYSRVDATYKFNFTPAFREVFVDDTWNYAMEARVGGGFRFGAVSLRLGAGVRMLLTPDQGSTISLDSSPFYTFDIDLGLQIGF